MRRDHLVDGAAAIGGLSHVALVDTHGRAVRPREGLAEFARRLVVACVACGEHRALAGEAAADSRADAARAARDEGHAPLELVARSRADIVVRCDVENVHGHDLPLMVRMAAPPIRVPKTDTPS